MSFDAASTKTNELIWQDVVSNGRRALRLCWETSPVLFSALVGCAMAASLFPAALAGLAGYVVTQVEMLLKTPEKDSMVVLLPALVVFSGIIVSIGLLQALRFYCESLLSAYMDLKITKQLVTHASSLDLSFFQLPGNHDILNRGSTFAGRDFLKFVMGVITVGSDGVQFVSLLGVMMWIQPMITPLLVLVVAPMIIFRWRVSKMSYRIHLAKTSKSRLRSYFAGELTRSEAIPVLKVFNLGPVLVERFERLSLDLIDLDRKLFRKHGIGQALGSAFFAIAFLVAASWAVQATLVGALALGSLVTYLTCAERFRACVARITKTAAGVFKNALFVHNLHDLLDEKPSIDTGLGLCPDGTRGRIQLQNVSFRYAGAKDLAIRKINLEILPGETIALVGANGAGKTTLANVIARLYDVDEGAVLLDGTDVRELSARWYYDQIAYVGQIPIRFETTAAENIAFGDMKRLKGNRAEIEAIAKEAGIFSIIEKLPSGFDTVLGRRFGDVDLSAGHWQRLAIARALAKNAPILIMDEPTANVDARSEFELFTALRELSHGKTTIIISHRFATVRSADRIVVMDEGQIVELGPHDQLIELGGIYAGLYRIQQTALNA